MRIFRYCQLVLGKMMSERERGMAYALNWTKAAKLALQVMFLNTVVETCGNESLEGVTTDVGVLVWVVYRLRDMLAHCNDTNGEQGIDAYSFSVPQSRAFESLPSSPRSCDRVSLASSRWACIHILSRRLRWQARKQRLRKHWQFGALRRGNRRAEPSAREVGAQRAREG